MFRYPFGFWYDGEMAGLAAAGRVARATRADTAEPALMVHTKAAQVTRIPTLGPPLNTTALLSSVGKLIHPLYCTFPARGPGAAARHARLGRRSAARGGRAAGGAGRQVTDSKCQN